mgnify:CR=1 FL=1
MTHQEKIQNWGKKYQGQLDGLTPKEFLEKLFAMEYKGPEYQQLIATNDVIREAVFEVRKIIGEMILEEIK